MAMEKKVVLLIDDNPDITTTLRDLLESSGVTVRTAQTFEEGRKEFATGGIDLAVVDIMLDQKTGIELLTELKATDVNLPPCIILTNSLKPENIAEAVELGITTFIQKADHDPGDIVDTILKRLEQK